MNARRVLVVDGDARGRGRAVAALRAEGFDVDAVESPAAGRSRLAAGHPPDVVVLEPATSDGEGMSLLRELVGEHHVPVVVLSRRGDEVDRVLGLELGAADYVVKPFSARELAIRVDRAARRPNAVSPRHEYGALAVDTAARRVTVDGRAVELTAREFDLLAFLVARPRRVFTRDELLVAVWHSSSQWQSPRTVTEHVRRLRAKLEGDARHPRWIRTVSNVGYRFDP